MSSFIVGFDAASDRQHRMSHCINNQPLSCKVASVFRNADDCPVVCRVGSAWQSQCQVFIVSGAEAVPTRTDKMCTALYIYVYNQYTGVLISP